MKRIPVLTWMIVVLFIVPPALAADICSPEVLVKFQTNGFWVERFKVKKGAVVSFTGQCYQIYRSLKYVHAVVRATIR